MELTEADFERRGIMQTMEHPTAGPIQNAGLAGALRRAHAATRSSNWGETASSIIKGESKKWPTLLRGADRRQARYADVAPPRLWAQPDDQSVCRCHAGAPPSPNSFRSLNASAIIIARPAAHAVRLSVCAPASELSTAAPGWATPSQCAPGGLHERRRISAYPPAGTFYGCPN
jgi:hypothetical protein